MRTKRFVLMGFVYLLCSGVEVVTAAPKESPQGTVTQNWDRNLPSASRFTVLTDFAGAAVRDNNTGLVWEQSPASVTAVFQDSTYGCANKSIGGLKGGAYLPFLSLLA